MACGTFMGPMHNWVSWALPVNVIVELTRQEGENKMRVQSGNESESLMYMVSFQDQGGKDTSEMGLYSSDHSTAFLSLRQPFFSEPQSYPRGRWKYNSSYLMDKISNRLKMKQKAQGIMNICTDVWS